MIFGSVLLGASTLLSAASNKRIIACADKKTGDMRYLSRGKCNKKSEIRVSWNLEGVPGPSGPIGPEGKSGQNIHIIDAEGRDLGIALGVYNAGNSADIFFEDGVWRLENSMNISSSGLSGAMQTSNLFSDSSCSSPLWLNPGGQVAQPLARGVHSSATGIRTYVKPAGNPFLLASVSQVYAVTKIGIKPNIQTVCLPRSTGTEETEDEYSNTWFTAVVETTPPAYTAPFSLVFK
jgi:hypothetical protein